ncbi:hypothetical protein K2Y11_21235 [bacterium]|nr:hypothetical protein [bacterium]
MENDYATIGQLQRELGLPGWKVRNAVDRMNGIPRAGLYRLVPRNRVPELEQLLGLSGATK